MEGGRKSRFSSTSVWESLIHLKKNLALEEVASSSRAPQVLVVKNAPPLMQETLDAWVQSPGLRREWLPTPVILARRIPWTEKPGGLQSTGLQRVGHD